MLVSTIKNGDFKWFQRIHMFTCCIFNTYGCEDGCEKYRTLSQNHLELSLQHCVPVHLFMWERDECDWHDEHIKSMISDWKWTWCVQTLATIINEKIMIEHWNSMVSMFFSPNFSNNTIVSHALNGLTKAPWDPQHLLGEPDMVIITMGSGRHKRWFSLDCIYELGIRFL